MKTLRHLSRTACALLLAVATSCQLPPGAPLADAPSQSQPAEVRRAMSADETIVLFQPAAELNLPAGRASINDTARLLAGLPPVANDGFDALRRSATWSQHQQKMDGLWATFETRHAAPIRTWSASEISDLQQAPGLFYPFSGPDFVFAHTFFPNVDTMILCGLEQCEPLPPLSQLNADEWYHGLDGLVTSVSTAMQFSFFITKDMRRDLVSTRFRGVLPLILCFMARTGHQVESIDLVQLNASGTPILTQGPQAPGVMIRAYGPDGAMRRVFYFRQDLSDQSLKTDGPFLRFVSSMGQPPAFVKSASYLMHETYFSTIRNYLMSQCRGIVQDPSGVPYANLRSAGLDLQLYGNYMGTLDIFSNRQQPDLIQAYREGRHNAQPLSFGIGYMYVPERTCLMVARRSREVSWVE
jgi:hypothetical protein